MKRILLLISIATLILSSCGVGTYSVTSGYEDASAICFYANQTSKINVNIDGIKYDIETIKQKTYKDKRNIKKTVKNQISITPGRHKVIATKDGIEIYNQDIFVSATEIKIIEL